MSINRRRTAALVAAGAVVAGGLSALGLGAAAQAADGDTPPSIVEDYAYPGAAQITGIKLIKGDGHILLVGCDQGHTSVEVYSFTAADPFCFQILGTTGSLTMELEQAYGIRNYQNYGLEATVSVEGADPTDVDVPADDWKGVGVGANQGQAVLLELRA